MIFKSYFDMKRFGFIIILSFIISCTGLEMQPEVKSSQDDKAVQAQDASGDGQSQEQHKNYVPGQVIIKFKDNISKEALDRIQQDLFLKTVRFFPHADLYLMEITDGSSVEKIIQKLNTYDAVKIAEPNYIRKIN